MTILAGLALLFFDFIFMFCYLPDLSSADANMAEWVQQLASPAEPSK